MPALRGSINCGCSEALRLLASQSTLHLGPQPSDPDTRPGTRAGPLALLLAAFLAIIIFLPPEGRVSVPLHDGLATVLGGAAFVLPVAFALLGALLLTRALRPDVRLPRRRLAGVVVLLVAVLLSEHLLTGGRPGTGLVGQWLSSLFLDLLGWAVTVLLLITALVIGTLLAFDLRLRLPRPVAAASPESRAES